MTALHEPLLLQAIADQRARMRGYEIASEALTFETVRALDYAFCRELFPHLPALNNAEKRHHFYLQSGVNEALVRVLPGTLSHARPNLYRSSTRTQAVADGFLLDAGLLWLADRLLTQLRAGFLQARLDPKRRVRGRSIIVLTATDDSVYQESIGHAGVAWLSDRARQQGFPQEERLRQVREAMLPQMTARIFSGVDDGEGLFPEADRHFLECAKVYLSRMPYRDLLGNEDRIGGRPYSDYVDVLTALSTMNEARLCTTTILHSERPQLDIRNLLTGATFADELIEAVSSFLDAETAELNRVLAHLVLSPHNSQLHLARSTPAWAPVIQTSANFCALPCYGLDMNPFVFLATELRDRYPSDWFKAANEREARWVKELLALFPPPRWRCAAGVKIKREGKVVTDIDFVAYDSMARDVALFQLKWQQPSISDEKIRRNNAGNLIEESNRWISVVSEWVCAGGMEVLAKRLGVPRGEIHDSPLFILGRYAAHFSGQSSTDPRAAWSDWGHFERERSLHPEATVGEIFKNLSQYMLEAKEAVQIDSFMVPLPGLILVVNPTKQPID